MAKTPLTSIMGLDFETMLEESRKRFAAEYAWTQAHCLPTDTIDHTIATRTPADAPTRINTTSLPAWLAVAKAAG